MLDRVKQLLIPDVSVSAKLTAVSVYFAKLAEATEARLIGLEARQLQRGEKGDKGDAGPQGPRGEVGPTGPAGVAGLQGPPGRDGKEGKPGVKGKDGVSVVDVEIAADNHLVVKLSNGKEIDAGELPDAETIAYRVSAGGGYQIQTSAQPPVNPSPYDFWFATNLRSNCN